MSKRLLIPLFILISTFAQAETIRTDVLVIGGGACGVAAAIQSARSKVKTLLVEPGPWLGGSMTMGGMCVLDANHDLPSGIWGEFRRKVTEYYHTRLGYDTSKNAILRFEPSVGAEILKKLTDTVKNLTVKLKTPWESIRKDGSEWEVIIMEHGEKVTVKARVVVDGTETGEVAAKAGAKFGDERDYEEVTWIAVLKNYGRKADKTILKPEKYDPSDYNWRKGPEIQRMLDDLRIPNDKYMIDPARNTDGITGPITHRQELYKSAKLRALGFVYFLQTELGYKNFGLDGQFGTPDSIAAKPIILKGGHVSGAVRMVIDDIAKPYDRQSKLYRTSIAVGDAMPHRLIPYEFSTYTIPLGVIVPKDVDNLLVTEKALSVTNDVNAGTNNPAVQMTLGQGVGATAAFCAFFKTTTKHLSVRTIQGEILDHKGYLVPFTDISQKDPHWRAIQQVCATGLLKGIQKQNANSGETHFEPNDTVRTAEVKPILNEIYTRAFIWFRQEKTGEKLTLGNLLYFISDYTLTDKVTLEGTIRKLWKPVFKLPGELDVNRPVTRLEFAVLANKYLNPFAKTVDLTGRIVN
ncbi:MAG: FAD-dependent oxidoreductase [Bacteroidetes bacterium]|nr:FAD-dependent oxidoreductase [Bacteroidota bacterium]